MFRISTIVICTDTYFESIIREWHRDSFNKWGGGAGGIGSLKNKFLEFRKLNPFPIKKKVGPF